MLRIPIRSCFESTDAVHASTDLTPLDVALRLGHALRRPPPIAAALYGVFMLLTVLVMAGATRALDRTVGHHLHMIAAAHSGLVRVARWVTLLGSPTWIAFTALVVVVLTVRRDWVRATVATAAIGGGTALSVLLEYTFHREGPTIDGAPLITRGLSYPSGPAASAVIAYGVILLLVLPALGATPRRLATAATMALALAVVASQVVLGVTWLTDVIAGLLFGLAWLALANPWLGAVAVNSRSIMNGCEDSCD